MRLIASQLVLTSRKSTALPLHQYVSNHGSDKNCYMTEHMMGSDRGSTSIAVSMDWTLFGSWGVLALSMKMRYEFFRTVDQ